jgi:hypothetical protein
MAFASRAVSKRGIRDRLAITLWGRRGQAPTGPAFTAVTATETLTFSETAARSVAGVHPDGRRAALVRRDGQPERPDPATHGARAAVVLGDSRTRDGHPNPHRRGAAQLLRNRSARGPGVRPHRHRVAHLLRGSGRRQDLHQDRGRVAHLLGVRRPLGAGIHTYLAESLSFAETAARAAQVFSRTAAESLTFSESATRAAYIRTRTAAEPLSFSETAARAAQVFVRTVAETLHFAETAATGGGGPRTAPRA